jgi:hypothetical protein
MVFRDIESQVRSLGLLIEVVCLKDVVYRES